MSRKDLDRLDVLKKVLNKELRQVDAARLLKISDRQIRKLLKRLRLEGPSGILSRLIGRIGNRQKPQHVKKQVLVLLREKYEGFGPTLAAEKLFELDGIKISKETVRNWMIEHHLWVVKEKRTRVHTTRLRRPCFGELIQEPMGRLVLSIASKVAEEPSEELIANDFERIQERTVNTWISQAFSKGTIEHVDFLEEK